MDDIRKQFSSLEGIESDGHHLRLLNCALLELSDVPDPEHYSPPCIKTLNHVHPSELSYLLASLNSSLELEKKPAKQLLKVLWRLIDLVHAPWPTLELLVCYSKLMSRLIRENGSQDALTTGDLEPLLDRLADKIHQTYESLAALVPDRDTAALIAPKTGRIISHSNLRAAASCFSIPISSNHSPQEETIIAIALANGPLLAAACLAVASRYVAAPVNPNVGLGQFRMDVAQLKAHAVLTTTDVADKLQLSDGWGKDCGIQIFIIDEAGDAGDLLSIRSLDANTKVESQEVPANRRPNKGQDTCLLLFTSGTSGAKKVVPITVDAALVGAAFVIDSWGLTSDDKCLNMMPLYHVGGLIRNIFAPILAGSSTICCGAFDHNEFWDVHDRLRPTWYYASPTMHSIILSTRPNYSTGGSSLRLICNAAGGLLPALAQELKQVFQCTVLPSYGMTECMPISSPPLCYRLERAGTSGVATGPDVAICSTVSDRTRLLSGQIGRIVVRGGPLFRGYRNDDGSLDRSALGADGWFDTGDLGYLDADGYLFITGRSKEVINRGGEIISPFEVEDAILSAASRPGSPIFGRVSENLAFSVKHDVLQEVVGIMIVTPPGQHRVDTRTIHEAIKSSLQQAKWPFLIVYSEALPRRNNKLLRIRLADRLCLPVVSDESPYIARHWEAVSPPVEDELNALITCRQCSFNISATLRVLKEVVSAENVDTFVKQDYSCGILEAILAPMQDAISSSETKTNLTEFKSRMALLIHNYLIPHYFYSLNQPLPRESGTDDNVDEKRLLELLDSQRRSASVNLNPLSSIARIISVFADILQAPKSSIQPHSDFFELGGDSLKAGRLLAAIRTEFGSAASVPVSLLFQDGSPIALARHIDEAEAMSDGSGSDKEGDNDRIPAGCEKTYSSTRPSLLLLQLIPMVIVYPMRRAFQWTLFMAGMSVAQHWKTNESIPGRLFNLILCILFGQAVARIVLPWIGIASKWAIIGRYKEGAYPMWGPYHTRWWLVQKIVAVCGVGVFGLTNTGRVFYCRLMGAKIGRNATLKHATLGEWDLIEIGDDAVLDRCVCRPFAVERNTTMCLSRVVVGHHAFVGLASIVAPGTCVPDGTCVGPSSSSWELEDAVEENREYSDTRVPQPHWAAAIFVTAPLILVKWVFSLSPWFAGLLGLVIHAPEDSKNPLADILHWFSTGYRVGYHYLALVLRVLCSPFIVFIFAVSIKFILDKLFGRVQPTSAQRMRPVDKWRRALMKSLLPVTELHEMTNMLGQHYEGTSHALRLLGAKVGRRVYWPGTGPSIGDYHLIEVGDDVVFGSRSHLITSDGIGSEKVVIRSGVMIADRVVLQPGVVVDSNSTMGSGALTRRSKYYPPHSTYVGSVGGDAVALNKGSSPPTIRSLPSYGKINAENDINTVTTVQEIQPDGDNTLSPFGRAFYLKQAPYRVLGPVSIFLYSSLLTVATAVYWNVPIISSIQISDRVFQDVDTVIGVNRWFDGLALFVLTSIFVALLTTLQAVLALVLIVAAKWILIGRRMPGNYDWDKSSYCQRWQVFLAIERLRRRCYRGRGILGMLTGTHWLVLYFRALGARIGTDCALFAGGEPSLYFTEPDLIEIGDRVALDDASLVAHINSRGKFDLNKLRVGDRCVLRTGSRLLSGAEMKQDSKLMEHTLVMGGDIVETGSVLQGWPSRPFSKKG